MLQAARISRKRNIIVYILKRIYAFRNVFAFCFKVKLRQYSRMRLEERVILPADSCIVIDNNKMQYKSKL